MTLFPTNNSFPGANSNISRQNIVNALSNGAFNITSIFGPPLGANDPRIVPINLPSTKQIIFGGLPPGAIVEIKDALTFFDGTPASRALVAEIQGLTSGISTNPNNPRMKYINAYLMNYLKLGCTQKLLSVLKNSFQFKKY